MSSSGTGMWQIYGPPTTTRPLRRCSATGRGSSPSTTTPGSTGYTFRTTNPLESVFSGVRLRTNAAKRLRRRDNALYLVFKIVERLSGQWRTLNGGANLMALVLEGCVFKDGRLQRREARQLAAAAA
jgi:hypothetical protein